jgi:WD40 repeat protein
MPNLVSLCIGTHAQPGQTFFCMHMCTANPSQHAVHSLGACGFFIKLVDGTVGYQLPSLSHSSICSKHGTCNGFACVLPAQVPPPPVQAWRDPYSLQFSLSDQLVCGTLSNDGRLVACGADDKTVQVKHCFTAQLIKATFTSKSYLCTDFGNAVSCNPSVINLTAVCMQHAHVAMPTRQQLSTHVC